MPRHVQDFGEYSVKNVKSFQGREGYGFNCNLYRNNRKIGFCMDDASGGGMYPIDWAGNIDRQEEQQLLNAHLETLPPVDSDFGGDPLRIDEGWFVEELVNEAERQKDLRKMRRQCQTKTLFRLDGDNRGAYHILNAPCDEATRRHLQRHYGERVTEIFNDVLESGNVPSVLEA